MDLAKCLKALEKENVQLKKLVVDLSLDNQILKEGATVGGAIRAPDGTVIFQVSMREAAYNE